MTQSTWLVNSISLKQQEQLHHFNEHIIWQHAAGEKDAELIKHMQAGDRIALTSCYTRNTDLPFAHDQRHIPVMAIQAIGVVQHNPQNGQTLDVEWQEIYHPPREWYFYTHHAAIWHVTAQHWMNRALIAFTFSQQPQDYQAFMQTAYWRDRFIAPTGYEWQQFYQSFACALLRWQQRREALLDFALQLAQQHQLNYLLNKQFNDICPFTIMGMFNRGISTQKRILIAQAWAQFLNIQLPVPHIFEGIPILNNQKSWFFAHSQHRKADDIDNLWQFFALAQHYADQLYEPELEQRFIQRYDQVSGQLGVGWNLTIALFWLRPDCFLSLDSQSQQYIREDLGLNIATTGAKGRCSGQEYVGLLQQLDHHFQQPYTHVHSFIALALLAWEQQDALKILMNDNDDDLDEVEQSLQECSIQTYHQQSIQSDGCFFDDAEVTAMLRALKQKKNLILQGPAGTGKTWLAKRLGYALIGHKSQDHIKVVQFHPNTSYEDFIRGWRPQLNPTTKQNELQLVDGPFLKWIEKAIQYPNDQFVLVIEEINRGQPAQIFGEMLTLLEASKRTETEALTLIYSKSQEKVYIPENLYVIGTMNLADRSLVNLDVALRRRFAFAHLTPQFNPVWQDYVLKFNLSREHSAQIAKHMQALNNEILAERHLGKACLIGHSYLTPDQPIDDLHAWYTQVVEMEIVPLLEEYWFDQPQRIEDWQQRLLGMLCL